MDSLSVRISLFLFFKGPNPASFCFFSFFSHDKYSTNLSKIESVDGVLWIRTRGGRMVGVDELWWRPSLCFYTFTIDPLRHCTFASSFNDMFSCKLHKFWSNLSRLAVLSWKSNKIFKHINQSICNRITLTPPSGKNCKQ